MLIFFSSSEHKHIHIFLGVNVKRNQWKKYYIKCILKKKVCLISKHCLTILLEIKWKDAYVTLYQTYNWNTSLKHYTTALHFHCRNQEPMSDAMHCPVDSQQNSICSCQPCLQCMVLLSWKAAVSIINEVNTRKGDWQLFCCDRRLLFLFFLFTDLELTPKKNYQSSCEFVQTLNRLKIFSISLSIWIKTNNKITGNKNNMVLKLRVNPLFLFWVT